MTNLKPWEAKLGALAKRRVAELRRDAEHWRERAEKAEASNNRAWRIANDATRIVERQNRCIVRVAKAVVVFQKRGGSQ